MNARKQALYAIDADPKTRHRARGGARVVASKIAASSICLLTICFAFAATGGHLEVLFQPMAGLILGVVPFSLIAFNYGFRNATAAYFSMFFGRKSGLSPIELEGIMVTTFRSAVAATHVIGCFAWLIAMGKLTQSPEVVGHAIAVMIVGYLYGLIFMAAIPGTSRSDDHRAIPMGLSVIPPLLSAGIMAAQIIG